MLSLTALFVCYSTIFVPAQYKTIQEAVVNASHNDTIIVSEGSYQENVSVTKPLSIKSDKGPDRTTVRAAAPTQPVFKAENTGNVGISGFTVTGSSVAGIYLSDIRDSTVSNNKAVKNASGISLYHSAGNTLTGNSATMNSQYGIYLDGSDGNTVTQNSAGSNGDKGIFLSSSHRNNITDNSVNLNTWNGILLWESNHNTVKDNRVWRNSFAIVMSDGSNNTLIDNSTWSNIYIIMPLVLAYVGIISYLLQKRILRAIYRV